MTKSAVKRRALLAARILLTVVAWLVLIIYAHRLGHEYVGGIEETVQSPVAQIGVQVFLFSIIIYLVILSLPVLPRPKLHGVFLIVFWVSLMVLGHQLSHQGLHGLQDFLASASDEFGPVVLVLSGTAYLLILALPFVPGVELGLLIMVFFGREGVIAAYMATVGGLSLAYAIASVLPNSLASRWLSRLRLSEASDDPEMTIGANMPDAISGKIENFLLKHRYLMLAASLNLPGNSALGGGGGIAFLCGLSGQFHWRRFILTIVLATAPIPLLVIFGSFSLEPLLERHGLIHELLELFEGFLIHG